MSDQTQNPVDGVKVAVYPTQTASVRHTILDGQPYLYAVDVIEILGIQATGPERVAATPEPLRAELVNGDGMVTLLNVAGVESLADGPVDEPFLAWVRSTFKPRRKRVLKGPEASRWGWQPIRDVVKASGYSGRSFVDAANKLDIEGVEHFSSGNYAAWSYGGCLPQDCLLIRAQQLLKAPAEALFTTEVLAALPNRGKGRRQATPAYLQKVSPMDFQVVAEDVKDGIADVEAAGERVEIFAEEHDGSDS